jgi:large subunit ribosomal protein L6
MSRIGKMPIPVPDNVKVEIDGSACDRFWQPWHAGADVPSGHGDQPEDDGVLTVSRPSESREHRSLHGLTRCLAQQYGDGCKRRLHPAPAG